VPLLGPSANKLDFDKHDDIFAPDNSLSRRKCCSSVPVCAVQLLQQDLISYLEVDVEQLQPLVLLRQGDVDALFQAAPQGLVDVPREVGGGQDDYVLTLLALRCMATINLASKHNTIASGSYGPLWTRAPTLYAPGSVRRMPWSAKIRSQTVP
jgi:hypothetical protein